MRPSIIASSLTAVASAAAAQDVTNSAAPVVTNNPAGAVYTATLPHTAFDPAFFPTGGNVKGSVYAVASPDGIGVLFQVKFSGLPSEGGPFLYHIHDQPVPSDGNCTGTKAHLDPYARGETPPCDSSDPSTCQVGDLSGKHGAVASDPFAATYTDEFVSLGAGDAAFLGNRSFVLHFANKTRIACANFTAVNEGSSGSSCAGSAPSLSSSFSSAAASTTVAPISNNATATSSTPTATSTVIQTDAGVKAHAPALMLAVGAAIQAFVL